MTKLEEAIERLQFGILTNLAADYSLRLNLGHPSEAVLLANCVLSYATAMNPIGDPAQAYNKKHDDLVREQALQLAGLAQVSKSLSYLYAAITILLAIRTGNPFSELCFALGARATELSLYVPSTFDICGSGDALECIEAIAVFAETELASACGREDHG